MQTVQLIQPEKDGGYTSNSRTGCYAPLGLISIATHVRQKFPNAQIDVLDGELMSNKAIIDSLKPGSTVGIETKLVNYQSALKIAESAKELECKVVFGGVYASNMADVIAEHRGGIVDHIVVGYGEKPFVKIMNGDSRKIIRNQTPAFNQLPTPDRNSYVNLETYTSNFRREHATWDVRATNIYTHAGCARRCVFCSRQRPQGATYFRRPNLVWGEITELVNRNRIDYLVDFSEDITQNLDWLKRLVSAKPSGINPVFHVFATAEGINRRSLTLLKRLNTGHIFVGMETGDAAIAKGLMKGENFSPETVLKAVRSITDSGMTLTPSFVLGLPGETQESLENTLRLAEEIHDINPFDEIFCTPLIPFPGSVAFERLRDMHATSSDLLDAEDLTRIWVNDFCDIDHETIKKYSEKILKLGRYTITMAKNSGNLGRPPQET